MRLTGKRRGGAEVGGGRGRVAECRQKVMKHWPREEGRVHKGGNSVKRAELEMNSQRRAEKCLYERAGELGS